MSVNFHPLDFDAIKKGDAWTVEQMEQLVGHPSTSKKYELAVLQLANRIEREMAMRNRPATVAVLKGVLRVLNDSEAAVHTAKQFQSGKRKLYRNLQRGLQVDRSQLTTEEA